MSNTVEIVGETFLLFVYGTLKRGGVRHHILEDQTALGEARTLPRYLLYNFIEHPALVSCDGDGRSVRGELYRVATNRIGPLDQLEDAPELFRLEPIALQGVAEPAFAYLYQQSIAGKALCDNDCWVNA